MSDQLQVGNPPLCVALRRSSRARRLSLRVSRLDGQISLTMPRAAPIRAAQDFLNEREDWLRAQLAQIDPIEDVALGTEIPFEGQMHQLCPGQRRVRRAQGAIYLPPARPIPALRAFLREEARGRLTAASDHFAGLLGRSYGKITLRDTRSRWGSCTARGDLMYSWRLVMAPPPVLRYVAAHEVAHLQEMNHSPAFWAVVEQLDPDWRTARAWLQGDGTALMRYRFDD